MERLIQYLDILEDAWYVVALLAERIRRIALQLCIFAIMAIASGLGIMLALTAPPVGLAVAALLTVTVLYRSATARTAREPAIATVLHVSEPPIYSGPSRLGIL